MSTSAPAWHGILVAAAVPFDERLDVDLDRFAEHIGFLAEHGCHGVVANGSLGEYQTLTAEERARVVTTAVAAAADRPGFGVVPGVAAYGSREACQWTEQAAKAGCPAVMLPPPTAYRADERAVLAHYREVAAVGLPVVAYQNPFDTRVDLTPALLARLHGDGLIVAVKDFSGDVRRAYELAEQAPGLDLLVGSDDVVLELAIAGAVGWIAGIPNARPEQCAALWTAARAGDLDTALPLYRRLHPLLRWDARPEFVQAIKLAMDLSGRYGGACRPPRQPLLPSQEADVRAAVERAGAADA